MNEPYGALIAALIAGVKQRTYKVTIPEGFTIAQTAARLSAVIPHFPAAQYVALTRHYPAAYRSPATSAALPCRASSSPPPTTCCPT